MAKKELSKLHLLNNKKEFPISGWKWVPYILGWFFGAANLLFWLIMAILHIACNRKEPFFNKDFHRRVYIWGLVVIVLIVLGLGLGLLRARFK